ncbi:hypothetical protein I872_05755 [Streptococcus cristatus AS 1.3089]|uniref:Uncharacterized protein n=1 Tax=Streptococcus cristatus AS 1.3089 TaxID=1302863 RepID=A0ABN4BAY1_STRCR|nr:hypothetical protein I872_05755 [Streptococcus cristatus AS 1.3089]
MLVKEPSPNLARARAQVAVAHILLHLAERTEVGAADSRSIYKQRGWDKSPSLSIVFGVSSKTQWLSGLYYN